MLRIEPARPEHAKALAELAETTFRLTFAADNTTANMARHCQASYGEAIQREEIRDPSLHTLLVWQDSQLTGYAQLRLGSAPACASGTRPGEILRFYLLPACHGQGLATQLMDTCLAWLRQAGCDVIWLGVWEHNPRAIAFYRKHGFEICGDHVFPLGEDPQRDLVMVRAL